MYLSLLRCFSSASYSKAVPNRGLGVTLWALSISIMSTSSAYALQASSLNSLDTAAYDCTGVKLEEVDPQNLTKAEQLALLDSVLIDSIDRYSSCLSQVQQEMSGGNGGAGGNAALTAAGGGSEGLETADSDTAESANTPQSDELSEVLEEGSNNTEVRSQTSTPSNTSRALPQANTQDRKKVGVIAPKNNDAIICTILYDAIITEKDTNIRIGLEQQYSDYECGN